MTAIHPIHRRLAEITAKARRSGGLENLSMREHVEFEMCLQANENFVMRLSFLEQLSRIAKRLGDMEFSDEVNAKIEKLTGR